VSLEIELKFRIPTDRLAALRRAGATRTAQVQLLAAVYFDTADDALAQARMALRLRCEGGQWVQTLKAEGANPMQRLEHNVLRDAADGGRPTLDLSLHDSHEAGALLARALAGAASLVERYATVVQRTRRVLRLSGASIEIALDEGRITAGAAPSEIREIAFCEIEFELLRGEPRDLLALAARWVARFDLVLDLRSKSERGQMLAQGQTFSAPTRARSLQWPAPGPGGPGQSTLSINAEVGLTTSKDILQAVARGDGPEQIFVTLGYAGWGAGQIESELAQNAWLTVPADRDVLFALPCEERVPAAMHLLGIDFASLSDEAGHA